MDSHGFTMDMQSLSTQTEKKKNPRALRSFERLLLAGHQPSGAPNRDRLHRHTRLRKEIGTNKSAPPITNKKHGYAYTYAYMKVRNYIKIFVGIYIYVYKRASADIYIYSYIYPYAQHLCTCIHTIHTLYIYIGKCVCVCRVRAFKHHQVKYA